MLKQEDINKQLKDGEKKKRKDLEASQSLNVERRIANVVMGLETLLFQTSKRERGDYIDQKKEDNKITFSLWICAFRSRTNS